MQLQSCQGLICLACEIVVWEQCCIRFALRLKRGAVSITLLECKAPEHVTDVTDCHV